MKSETIRHSTVQFLVDISLNNNREWFNDHKEDYLYAQNNVCTFIDQLIPEMNRHDMLENESGKKSLYRIYNDVRFSKDKSPYNPRFAFSLRRATRFRRGGYYMQIKPGNSFLACGFFAPNPADLKRIREDISVNFTLWNTILNTKGIQSNFGSLRGNLLDIAPRGYDKNHEAIQLLRHKQFILRHEFTDQEVTSYDFLIQVNSLFQSVRPFFDHMSEILTTNANGESLIKTER